MAPFVPYHVSAGSNKIVSFGGLLTTEFLEPPLGRGFLFRQTYRRTLDVDVPPEIKKLIDSAIKPQGPPGHMHRYQNEYFRVESGVLAVRINGILHKKTAEDGEWSVKAGDFHSFFRHPDYEDPVTVYLSASDSGRDYKLDRVFFENWYGYWHDALLYNGKMNYIQWLAIYDAGDAYPDMPTWLPFRQTISYWNGVIVGRWLGGLLGYKPFFKEYTTDWDYAASKMQESFFQRRLVHKSYAKSKSWLEVDEISQKPKAGNAEYESWTKDLTKASNSNDKQDTRKCSETSGSSSRDSSVG